MIQEATASASPPTDPPLDGAGLERLTAQTDQLLERWSIGDPSPDGRPADGGTPDDPELTDTQ